MRRHRHRTAAIWGGRQSEGRLRTKQNQDYFLGTNNDFGDILKALATGACNNQLTITKQIEDSSGALISPTPADANGWTFANTISGGGDTIVSPVTTAAVNGANGVAQAALTIRA